MEKYWFNIDGRFSDRFSHWEGTSELKKIIVFNTTWKLIRKYNVICCQILAGIGNYDYMTGAIYGARLTYPITELHLIHVFLCEFLFFKLLLFCFSLYCVRFVLVFASR